MFSSVAEFSFPSPETNEDTQSIVISRTPQLACSHSRQQVCSLSYLHNTRVRRHRGWVADELRVRIPTPAVVFIRF